MSFPATFATVGRFPGAVVWLRPHPSDPFSELIAAFVEAFPDCPPYGDTVPDPIPHLTLGDGVDRSIADSLERKLIARLPVSTVVERLTLLIEDDDGRWSAARTWPLRPGSAWFGSLGDVCRLTVASQLAPPRRSTATAQSSPAAGRNPVSRYSVIEAADAEIAVWLANGCPDDHRLGSVAEVVAPSHDYAMFVSHQPTPFATSAGASPCPTDQGSFELPIPEGGGGDRVGLRRRSPRPRRPCRPQRE